VAQQYGLTGVSALWSVAQATAALIAALRIVALTRVAPAGASGELPSAAPGHPS
jgi:hypothetical protein